MQVCFNPTQAIDRALREVAGSMESIGQDFEPGVRTADPKFGDLQANGILGFAKRKQVNPRELGQELITAVESSGLLDSQLVEMTLSGPGFLNFRFTNKYLWQWLLQHTDKEDFRGGANTLRKDRTVVIDYPSANTAKQAHIGHIRPMVIGEAIARLLDFCGAKTIRDNHIGDWGTNFGTLIMKIKRDGIDLKTLGEDALKTLDQLYKDGSALEAERPELRDVSRNELVLLQNGDSENTAIWEQIVEIS